MQETRQPRPAVHAARRDAIITRLQDSPDDPLDDVADRYLRGDYRQQRNARRDEQLKHRHAIDGEEPQVLHGGPKTLGLVGLLVGQSVDVASALRNAIRYLHLHDRGAVAQFAVADAMASLSYTICEPDIEGSD